MDVSAALKSGARPAKSVQPHMSAFDYPPDLAKAAAVWLATPGDRNLDAYLVQWPAIFVVILNAYFGRT